MMNELCMQFIAELIMKFDIGILSMERHVMLGYHCKVKVYVIEGFLLNEYYIVVRLIVPVWLL